MLKLDRLVALLDERGLTANAASSRAGLGRDYVRDLIRGKVKDPSASRLRRLADALLTTPEYLAGETEYSGQRDPTELGKSLLEIAAKPFHATELPINYRIEPGFFPNDGELSKEVNWPVASLNMWDTSQWLEHAPLGDNDLVPKNSLVHVVELTLEQEFREDQLVVCLVSRDSGTLFSRRVFRAIVALEALATLSPSIPVRPGEPEPPHGTIMPLPDLLSGENRYGVKVVGRIEAIYQFFHHRTAERLRGIPRISS